TEPPCCDPGVHARPPATCCFDRTAAMDNDAVMNPPDGAGEGITRRAPLALRLALKVLLVGVICHLSTEIVAHNLPPHYISPLWPTNAILLCVLVVTPIRHWWAYAIAAFSSSVSNNARAGAPIPHILIFLAADSIEVFIAAVGVRRVAGGLRAFDSLGSLIAYLIVVAVIAPCTSAFLAAFAGGAENYWYFLRLWYLSDTLAYLAVTPAVLTWIAAARTTLRSASHARAIEACLLGCGLIAIGVGVFFWPNPAEGSAPALVYLPLPFLLWAAVRFGPLGVNTSLLIVALLSISGAIQ